MTPAQQDSADHRIAHELLAADYPSADIIRRMRVQAVKWFRKQQRDLPWRRKSTPYRVWVSEIMLQQTQVATVIDYFNRFLKHFPTVKDLAAADEGEVLALWEGLGYYRRARNLHAAAQLICRQYDGKFPQHYDEVLGLPGIGRYTAGAILSISRNQPFPILEGNTYRLHARLLGLLSNPRDREPEKLLWQFATDILPGNRSSQSPSELNQALMEIGSEVCKVKNPDCRNCPLKSNCVAYRYGLENEIPKSGNSVSYENRRQALLILENRSSRILCRQNQDGEWWSGLWDFVRLDLPDNVVPSRSRSSASDQDLNTQTLPNPRPADHEFIEEKLGEYGIQVKESLNPLFSLKQAVTRYRIQLNCYYVRQFKSDSDKFQLQPLAALKKLPLNVTARKALQRIEREKKVNASSV